jgi:FKBP12-rapamycin complex-associated protein
VCMEHLLGVMRNPAERTTGFAALGEMAGAVGDALTPYLPAITPLLREAVSKQALSEGQDAGTLMGSLITQHTYFHYLSADKNHPSSLPL